MISRVLGLQLTDSIHMLDNYAKLVATPSWDPPSATGGYAVSKVMFNEPGYGAIGPPPMSVLENMTIVHPARLMEHNWHTNISQSHRTQEVDAVPLWHSHLRHIQSNSQRASEECSRSQGDTEGEIERVGKERHRHCKKRLTLSQVFGRSSSRSFIQHYSLPE